MPVEVYHNLIEAVHEDIGILHRYMRLRKKLMKTDELHMYDLYTSLVADADVKRAGRPDICAPLQRISAG